MISLVSEKSATALCFAIALTATAQLQNGGICRGDDMGMNRAKGLKSLFGCTDWEAVHLTSERNCNANVKALNDLGLPTPIECVERRDGFGSAVVTLTVDNNCNCDAVATALNNLDPVIELGCKNWYGSVYGYDESDAQILYVNYGECADTARALTALIADGIESDIFKTFFKIALPITGAVFGGSGYYAYNHLGGDENLPATFSFALFVAFRVFDLMSDWGMYAISLASQHKGTPLRHACMVFSIIGSILLILDLKTMRERAEHWFGVKDSSESLKTVGYGMLAIVLLEDVPQMSITIVYLSEIVTFGREVDPVAITSLVLSVISMIANAFIAIRSLC